MLSLQGVSKRVREGQRERTILRGVSLEIGPGELVGIWGLRRSGRTTLLRIAAGIESPDGGIARFRGRDLTIRGSRVLGAEIGYVQKRLRGPEEQSVLDHVSVALLARGVDVLRASRRAREVLLHLGAEGCAAMRTSELGGSEAIRVALARTLALGPSLIVLDEPTSTVELSERDDLLAVLRTLTAQGIAMLVSSGEPGELAGFDRVLTLDGGELRGPAAPELAPVVALHRHGM